MNRSKNSYNDFERDFFATLRNDKRPVYYTLIFFTISPYRSFFIVIFFEAKTSPPSASQKPRNPTQKSVSTAPRVGALWFMIEVAESPPERVDGTTPVFTLVSVSMKKNDITIIATPSPTCVHFQSFLRMMPKSKSPRTSPIIGNT